MIPIYFILSIHIPGLESSIRQILRVYREYRSRQRGDPHGAITTPLSGLTLDYLVGLGVDAREVTARGVGKCDRILEDAEELLPVGVDDGRLRRRFVRATDRPRQIDLRARTTIGRWGPRVGRPDDPFDPLVVPVGVTIREVRHQLRFARDPLRALPVGAPTGGEPSP